MKKYTIISIFFFVILIFTVVCNAQPTAENYLKDDSQRKEIIHLMLSHQPYLTEMMIEMMNSMMNNDSCSKMMMSCVMKDPNMKGMHMDVMMNNMLKDPINKQMQIDKMMNLSKEDTTMCLMLMRKSMIMCNADSTKCQMMMGTMQSHPNVMKYMKRMCKKHKMK